MNFIYSILLTSISVSVFSQTTVPTEKTIEQIIQEDFAAIDFSKSTDLIPFKTNKKWGYVDRLTKKVVVPAKYSRLNFFRPNMDGVLNGNDFTITKDGAITVIKYDNEVMMVEEVDDEFSGVSIISSKDGYKGFKVNEAGEVIAYSDLYHYHRSGFPTWNVSPFKIKGKTYARAINKETRKSGVIDTLGNTLKGFEFKYDKILLNRYASDRDNAWFYIKGENGLWSLVNSEGSYKLRDKITTYPLTSATRFGIAVLRKDKLTGLFDHHTMEWVLEPQNELRIGTITYSSAIELDSRIPEGREKANIYYSVYDKNLTYYIDLEGNKYLPDN